MCRVSYALRFCKYAPTLNEAVKKRDLQADHCSPFVPGGVIHYSYERDMTYCVSGGSPNLLVFASVQGPFVFCLCSGGGLGFFLCAEATAFGEGRLVVGRSGYGMVGVIISPQFYCLVKFPKLELERVCEFWRADIASPRSISFRSSGN